MQAQIVPILQASDYSQEIARAAELLQLGKLIVLPTETVYGVAGLLTHPDARQGLSEIRQTQVGKPFTIHLASRDDAKNFLGDISDMGGKLMRKLWPGPVGLVFDVADDRRREVTKSLDVAETDLYSQGAITLRCPDHRVFADVAAEVDGPIALTTRGENHRASDLPEDILSRVETVLDAGETRFPRPSTLLRVKEGSYEILRAGIYDQRIIDRLLKTTVLFVCSGNTCRSPMAEGIARKMIADKFGIAPDELEKRQIVVMSAGSFALPGGKAAAEAVQVMRDMSIDISRHRSRPLSMELINQSDAIFVMSRGHAQDVMAMAPGAADKVMTLDPDGDVEDPIGGDLSLYKETADRLKVLIQKRLDEGLISS